MVLVTIKMKQHMQQQRQNKQNVNNSTSFASVSNRTSATQHMESKATTNMLKRTYLGWGVLCGAVWCCVVLCGVVWSHVV
jgi:hypothetical protein